MSIIGNTVGTPMNPKRFAEVGKSAYELATENGFVGTEKEWLASLQGERGGDGQDGISPVVSTASIMGGNRITITDANGTKTVDVMNGVDGNPGSPGSAGKDGVDGVGIETIGFSRTPNENGEVTVTFILTNGESYSFQVRYGKDGVAGQDGSPGKDGADGSDGVGIASAVLNADYTLTLNFTDGTKYTTPSIRGATGAAGSDGKDGQDGAPGATGSPGKDGVSATHSWSGTTLTVTSASGTSSANLKGEKGDKGDTGDPGSPGSAGKDGSSVTVESVSESSADGGSNVVTFSDGKTVTIKNGSKGSTGATGSPGSAGADGVGVASVAQTTTSTADGGTNVVTVTLTNGQKATFNVKNGSKGSTGAAGKDGSDATVTATSIKNALGYTPANETAVSQLSDEIDALGDQESIVQQVIAALGTPVFGRVDADNNIVLTGELSDGTYTVKYEDADGGQTEIGTIDIGSGITNLIPLSINADGTLYNGGKGWNTGYRLNSTGAETAENGQQVIGFIPAKLNDTIYLKNVNYVIGTGATYVWCYDANFNYIAYNNAMGMSGSMPDGVVTDANNVMTQFTANANFFVNVKQGNLSDIAYIRLNCQGITDESIITVNQPIV